MKKFTVIYLVVFLLAGTSAFAQFTKGRMLVGGAMGLGGLATFVYRAAPMFF